MFPGEQPVVQRERQAACHHEHHDHHLDAHRVVVADRLRGRREPSGVEAGEEQPEAVPQAEPSRDPGDPHGDGHRDRPDQQVDERDLEDETGGPSHARDHPFLTSLGGVQGPGTTSGGEQCEHHDHDALTTHELGQLAVEPQRVRQMVEILDHRESGGRQPRHRLEPGPHEGRGVA
jgi:alkylated DNA nucleotide flippase Atl1